MNKWDLELILPIISGVVVASVALFKTLEAVTKYLISKYTKKEDTFTSIKNLILKQSQEHAEIIDSFKDIARDHTILLEILNFLKDTKETTLSEQESTYLSTLYHLHNIYDTKGRPVWYPVENNAALNMQLIELMETLIENQIELSKILNKIKQND